MSFGWDTKLNNFLFYGWNITTAWVLLAACTFVGALAFAFEWIRLIQARHRQKELIMRSKQLKTICPMMEQSSLLPKRLDRPLDLSLKHRMTLYTCDKALWLSLHNLGYLIMLIVMLYNGWMFLSVLIGGGLGYFIFGPNFMKLNMENCAIIRDTYCMANCSTPDTPRDGESTPAMEASTSGTSCHVHTVSEVQVHNNELSDETIDQPD